MYQRSKTQSVVEAALCIALAVVSSRLRLFRLPQGGSVTLEIVPLLVYAMRWGLLKGIGAGAVAGLLQYVMGGYVVIPCRGCSIIRWPTRRWDWPPWAESTSS